jgi:microcystin-dependent protein
MTEPFLGQVTMAAFDFAPKGHARCDGTLLPINQNQALFALLGTMYGGNGQTSFALPDLRGRTPIHVGAGHRQGQHIGQSSVTLSAFSTPTHTHQVAAASGDGDSASPQDAVFAGSPNQLYHSGQSLTSMGPGVVGTAGGSQPHPNMQPYTVINCYIALQGIFPSRN